MAGSKSILSVLHLSIWITFTSDRLASVFARPCSALGAVALTGVQLFTNRRAVNVRAARGHGSEAPHPRSRRCACAVAYQLCG